MTTPTPKSEEQSIDPAVALETLVKCEEVIANTKFAMKVGFTKSEAAVIQLPNGDRWIIHKEVAAEFERLQALRTAVAEREKHLRVLAEEVAASRRAWKDKGLRTTPDVNKPIDSIETITYHKWRDSQQATDAARSLEYAAALAAYDEARGKA